jgi:hypothetical protein
VAQVVDHLPSKFKALHLNPVTTSPAPKPPQKTAKFSYILSILSTAMSRFWLKHGVLLYNRLCH